MALNDVLSTIVKRLHSLELWRDSLLEPTNSTCILRSDASQAFADGVAAAVTFGVGTEIRDLDGLHSTALNRADHGGGRGGVRDNRRRDVGGQRRRRSRARAVPKRADHAGPA